MTGTIASCLVAIAIRQRHWTTAREGKGNGVRRLTGFGVLTVLALLLVACGGDSGDDEPTATAEPTTEVVATIAEPTTPAVTEPSTPVASPAAATPVDSGSTPIATPVLAVATPDIATPVASPVTDPAGMAAVPDSNDAATQTLTGTVLLPGTANERFVISDDGCIGLGEYAGLQAGQQVIVRNETGVVIGIANLAATGSAVVCSWTFEIEVPVSDYYEVSIPMRAEQVYAANDVAASDGQIELTLP